MMEHKRLKEKLETILTLPELPFEEDLTAVDCKQMYNILCKIEQGTLIELPCKVGDNFYCIEKLWVNGWIWEVVEYTITSILIRGNHIVLNVVNDKDIYEKEHVMYIKKDGTFEFGEFDEDYCFFIKAKAEQRLKELQE